MATTHNFVFDSLSRIGDDVCGISERDMQNQKHGSYITQNHWASNCGMKAPINFATSQPNIYYTGGVGVTEGCTVDNDSRLRPKVDRYRILKNYNTIQKSKLNIYELEEQLNSL